MTEHALYDLLLSEPDPPEPDQDSTEPTYTDDGSTSHYFGS